MTLLALVVAAAVSALATLAAAGWADAAARERAQAIADRLAHDMEVDLLRLPPWVVDDASRAAQADPAGCTVTPGVGGGEAACAPVLAAAVAEAGSGTAVLALSLVPDARDRRDGVAEGRVATLAAVAVRRPLPGCRHAEPPSGLDRLGVCWTAAASAGHAAGGTAPAGAARLAVRRRLLDAVGRAPGPAGVLGVAAGAGGGPPGPDGTPRRGGAVASPAPPPAAAPGTGTVGDRARWWCGPDPAPLPLGAGLPGDLLVLDAGGAVTEAVLVDPADAAWVPPGDAAVRAVSLAALLGDDRSATPGAARLLGACAPADTRVPGAGAGLSLGSGVVALGDPGAAVARLEDAAAHPRDGDGTAGHALAGLLRHAAGGLLGGLAALLSLAATAVVWTLGRVAQTPWWLGPVAPAAGALAWLATASVDVRGLHAVLVAVTTVAVAMLAGPLLAGGAALAAAVGIVTRRWTPVSVVRLGATAVVDTALLAVDTGTGLDGSGHTPALGIAVAVVTDLLWAAKPLAVGLRLSARLPLLGRVARLGPVGRVAGGVERVAAALVERGSALSNLLSAHPSIVLERVGDRLAPLARAPFVHHAVRVVVRSADLVTAPLRTGLTPGDAVATLRHLVGAVVHRPAGALRLPLAVDRLAAGVERTVSAHSLAQSAQGAATGRPPTAWRPDRTGAPGQPPAWLLRLRRAMGRAVARGGAEA